MDSTALSRRTFLRRLGVMVGAGALARWAPPESRPATAPQMIAHRALRVGRAQGSVAPPRIVTRAEWGANEARRHTQSHFGNLNSLVIHHTVTDPTDNPAADLRDIYRLHLARDDGRWGDIGYHFLIHPNGHIHEGRRARTYAEGELHDAHNTEGAFLQGIHARGANRATAGIALIGDYRYTRPTVPALASLTQLSAWLCARHGIDPLESGSIIGHTDTSATACPGDATYDLLPDLRLWVANHMAASTGAQLSEIEG